MLSCLWYYSKEETLKDVSNKDVDRKITPRRNMFDILILDLKKVFVNNENKTGLYYENFFATSTRYFNECL